MQTIYFTKIFAIAETMIMFAVTSLMKLFSLKAGGAMRN